MSEQRTPYQIYNATPRDQLRYIPPRIAFPGSRLETLVECLDEIAELAPDAYPLRVNAIHTGLRATLEGEITPEQLIVYLLDNQ